MTTNEKINLLITRITDSTDKLFWVRSSDGVGGWSAILPNDRRIKVFQDDTIRITTEYDEDLIPPEDLNQTHNTEIRNKLTQTVATIYRDRSTIIDSVLAELNKL